MVEHDWPSKNKLPEGRQHFTTHELIEMFQEIGEDEPVWIDNYWQLIRRITQRPIDVVSRSADGWHIG